MSVTPIQFPSIPGVGGTPSGVNLEPADLSGMGGVQGVSSASPTGGAAGIDGTAATDPTTQANGAEFGNLVLDGIDRLDGLTNKADNLAVQAATGNLTNIHDYTIAASEAQVATQLTTSVRNQALDAFNKILQMQV
ncbi:MAG: flagellar hook-basal body complex protein FliE [Nocardioidaceae bacterium]|nr:flagellar hook-basal body complex protein FliE [Nocardioidaceae bacterium]MCL2613795.1 flagellar hook-basal body complex protein FliE [Nocardioidaceae bacterium]